MIQEIKKVCEERNIPLELHDVSVVGDLLQLAIAMGYSPICETVDVDGEKVEVPYGSTESILVQIHPHMNKYNNGVYFFKLQDGAYVLEVVIPNTADKSKLITDTVAGIENHFVTLDTADLDVYDLTKVFSHVLANIVAKPLAKNLFPASEFAQHHFTDIYYPRFLANMARYHLGDEGLMEESINAEPWVVKLMIEGNESLGLVGSPETQVAKESAEKQETKVNDND